jgi:hypothetical protein
MSKSNTVVSYLMTITWIRDQLVAIGEAVDDAELVKVALNGFLGSWEPFVQWICSQEKMPPFDRLWIDCIQEEARIESRNKQRGSDDENQALAAHARKGKGKGSTRGETSIEQWKKKDLSKVKCFACHKQGHYASQCPQQKREREATSIISRGGSSCKQASKGFLNGLHPFWYNFR